jgi:hypothetical protein
MPAERTVYVKTTKREPEEVAAAFEKCARAMRTTSKVDESSEDEELSLQIDGLAVVEVTTHRFGLALVATFEPGVASAVAELLDDVGMTLGDVVAEEPALALVAQEERDGWTPKRARRPRSVVRKAAAVQGEVVAVVAAPDGSELARATLQSALFRRQILPGGMLAPSAVSDDIPSILTDAGRFPLRGARLVCTLFDGAEAKGRARVRTTYQLDGYGRISSFEEERLR